MNNPVTILETDVNEDILADLGSKKARGLNIDVYEVIALLDFSKKTHLKVKEWILDEKIITNI